MPKTESPPSLMGLLQTIELVGIRHAIDWQQLKQIARGYPDVEKIETKLGWLLGSGNLTVVIERHYIDKDFRDSYSAYFSKRFHTPSNRCLRLHFFRGELTDPWIDRQDLEYLGYSVISSITPGGMGRTLISTELVSCPKGWHLHAKTCEETIHLLGRNFQVSGFPYTCQDQEIARCAQASLWMLVRYFSNKYPNYREVGPHQLANLVADIHLGRLFPSNGLTVWQSAEILRRLGFHPVVHDRRAFEDEEGEKLAARLGFKCAKKAFAHLFYTYIESGIPLLVGTKSHALVAFGHLSDYSAKPDAEDATTDGFFHSSVLNRGFMTHDDARLPYGRMEFESGAVPEFEEVVAFIAPMPEKTFLPADTHQRLARQLLTTGGYSMAQRCPELAAAVTRGEIVLRSFLTTGTRFKSSLSKRKDFPVPFLEPYLLYSLPHFIWVTEVLELDKYPARCIGQVVWDATAAPENLSGFLFLQYPGLLFMNLTPHFNRPLGPMPKDIVVFPLQTPNAEVSSFEPFNDNLNHRQHTPHHG